MAAEGNGAWSYRRHKLIWEISVNYSIFVLLSLTFWLFVLGYGTCNKLELQIINLKEES